MSENLRYWLIRHSEEWQDYVEKEFLRISEGQVRAFRTKFITENSLCYGDFYIEVLSANILQKEYPQSYYLVSRCLQPSQYLHIFDFDNIDQKLLTKSILDLKR